MRSARTVAQVRSAEAAAAATLPDGTLMQRAAHGLAGAVLDVLGTAYGARVRLLVGSGDNGGDALWAGAVLRRRGVAVDAVLLADHVHGAGLAALRAAGGRVLDATDPHPRPDLVVDGVVGIGGRPGLRPEAVAALAAVAGVPVVAVDVPSGVEVDTGGLDGPHVRAALTVAFGTLKVAHLVDPAAQAAGAVHLVDLALDLPPAAVTALQPADVAGLLPRPGPDDHKYTRGVVGVRAGSARYPGAGLLCVAGAASGLVGMVRYVGDDEVGRRVREVHPEVVGPGRVQAWTVGSGTDDGARGTLETALADGVPLCLDADALAALGAVLGDTPGGAPGGGGGRVPVPAVLTPHAGELARLLGTERAAVEAAPLAHARAAAERWGCTVLLKGRHSLTARPDGAVRVTTTGPPWLATAGAGDVLAGLVGALLAAGLEPFDAASVGSWLHGAAATLASADGPLVASAVAAALPAAVRALGRGPRLG